MLEVFSNPCLLSLHDVNVLEAARWVWRGCADGEPRALHLFDPAVPCGAAKPRRS